MVVCHGGCRSVDRADIVGCTSVARDDFPYTVIYQKFMVSGHSYLPNNRDFGVESARRRQPQIFIPEDCSRLVEKARRTNPFTVVRLLSPSAFVSVNRVTENITN